MSLLSSNRGNGKSLLVNGDNNRLIELHQVDKVFQSSAGAYRALKSIDL